CQQYYDTPLSF
nr:immunoglobulin light chain junction region [Macaca mulatta]MPN99648.1 immunoglobulin light chain junction region [Macaca mulatta]